MLTREDGTLAGDACSSYGAPDDDRRHAGPERARDRLLPLRAHRHRQRRQHDDDHDCRQGRHSRAGRPGLVLADSSADVHTTGTTAFYRPAGSGSFDVTASSTDGQSGSSTTASRCLAGFTGSGAGATRTYTLATPTEPNGAKPVTARNQALPLERHQLHPHLGRRRTDRRRTDRQRSARQRRRHAELRRRRRLHDRPPHRLHRRLSGIATSTLTREQGTLAADACSAYGAPTTLVGTPAQSGLATGCYRYVLTGTDNVGNTSTITTVVKVDLTDPTAPSLLLADTSADVHTTGTTAFYRPAGTGSFDVTASSTDGQSGIASYSFPALTGFTLSGTGGATHLHPRHPHRAQRRQDRHRKQQRRPHQQLHLHPHGRFDGSGRRFDHGERRRLVRHRRHRRAREDRSHGRRLRPGVADVHSRDRDARQRCVRQLRRHRPGDDSRRQRRGHPDLRLLPLHAHRHRQRRQPGRHAERDREGRHHSSDRSDPDAFERDRQRPLPR